MKDIGEGKRKESCCFVYAFSIHDITINEFMV